MSTRILFADDSVTAQNMGKRILTEAGYEVVAVSNGAAAVKKIAEQKPDIIILDLYMPGYSGLEVCEKVRGSMATLKTPVLLTVGKMEPYRPEDANRVRADGVIVKPFEASDLLAIIKKFEERIVPSPPPLAQQAMEGTVEDTAELEALPVETSEATPAAPQPTLDVPDHMASSSAFTDLLTTENTETPLTATPAITLGSAAAPAPRQSSVPEYELPPSWRREEEQSKKAEIELPPASTSMAEPPQHDVQVFAATAAQQEVSHDQADVTSSATPSRPLQIPVYQESAQAAGHEIVPTSATPIGEIEIPRDPYLEESAAEATRNTPAPATEPGLISTLQPDSGPMQRADLEAAEMMPMDTDFSITHSRKAPVDVPVEAPSEAASAPATHPDGTFSDSDFEARVAAALGSYDQTGSPQPIASSAPAGQEFRQPAPQAMPEVQAARSASLTPLEHIFQSPARPSAAQPEPSGIADSGQQVPAFEYSPPVGRPERPIEPASPSMGNSADKSGSQEPEPVVTPDPLLDVLHARDSAAGPAAKTEEQALVAAVRAVAASASAENPASRDSIAQAVARVVERLKPELVDEILRELKPKE